VFNCVSVPTSQLIGLRGHAIQPIRESRHLPFHILSTIKSKRKFSRLNLNVVRRSYICLRDRPKLFETNVIDYNNWMHRLT